jgi:TRAP-type C4-dicarboxylate transport system permease small subunit
MRVIANTITFLTKLNSWITVVILAFLMVFITLAILSRSLGFPIIGDVEIVQVCMVLLIMAALSYTEAEKKHISIGLIVDLFPKVIQQIFDFIGYILTCIVGWAIAIAFYKLAIHELSQSYIVSTSLLKIPHYPLKLFVSFGAFMWGLQALLKTIQLIIKIANKEDKKKSSNALGGSIDVS